MLQCTEKSSDMDSYLKIHKSSDMDSYLKIMHWEMSSASQQLAWKVHIILI